MDNLSAIASKLHDLWREPRRLSDGLYKFEPRWKNTSDPEWIVKHGINRVDIANTAYYDLPRDWQKENLASAQVALEQINCSLELEQPLDGEFIEAASAVIHEEWLKRNGEYASAEQKLPYFQLSEEEKEKDRVIIRAAIEEVQSK